MSQFQLVQDGTDHTKTWRAYEGLTDKQIEASLVDQMMLDIENGAAFPEIKTVMTEPNNKWRVVSGMQKAIRQSDVTNAVRLATALHNSTEADTLWRRIGVTGIEDIGVANLPLAALTFAVSGKKAWRQANGGVAIPQYIAASMAKTLKDRTACNLACWVNATANWGISAEDVSNIEGEDILTRATWLKVHADGITNEKREQLYPPSKAKAEDYISALPTLAQYVYRRGKAAGAEGLYAAMAVIMDYLQAMPDDYFTVEKREPLEPCLIKGVPSYAYDKHTYEGKKAIAYFLKACEPIAKWDGWCVEGMTYSLKMRAMGSAVFYAEGGEYLVDRLTYPLGIYVSRMELAAFAKIYMLTPQQFRDLHQMVSDNLGALNYARGKIMQST